MRLISWIHIILVAKYAVSLETEFLTAPGCNVAKGHWDKCSSRESSIFCSGKIISPVVKFAYICAVNDVLRLHHNL
jgi:hypothetical protein